MLHALKQRTVTGLSDTQCGLRIQNRFAVDDLSRVDCEECLRWYEQIEDRLRRTGDAWKSTGWKSLDNFVWLVGALLGGGAGATRSLEMLDAVLARLSKQEVSKKVERKPPQRETEKPPMPKREPKRAG